MRRAFLLLAFLLPPAAALAASERWVAVGPPGGDVRALAADPRDPRILYLGTGDGFLYRSDDSGGRWQRLTPGFPLRGMSLDEVAVDARGRVLVGYWEVAGTGGGVARSADGGRSFTLLPGLSGESVRALALAAKDPDVLVAGSLSGVFRSDDGGASWRRISPRGHAEIRNVESVAVDPADPDQVYVGTWHLPWKTVDGGLTWRPMSVGIIEDSDIFTLTVDRRTRERLYATACTGIYRSSDAGGRWTKVRGIPASSRRTRAFAQDPERPEALYAGTTEGVWASEDGGANWRLVTPKDLVVNAITVLPGGTLLLGCDGAGVLRSTDRGRSWSASNDGFSERFVSRVLFDPGRGQVLAGVLGDRQHGGVFSAPDPAGPWTRLGAGLEGREVLSLGLAGAGVLAGTDDGIFLSDSPRRLWTRLPTVVDGRDAHPRVTDVTVLSERVFLAATPRGVLRTADAGATWRRPDLGVAGAVSALAVSEKDRRLVIASTSLGLFESRDAGNTWARVSDALTGLTMRGLAFLPGSDRTLLAPTPKGLLRSEDGGRTWTRRWGLPFSDVTGLALAPDGRTVFASDFGGGGLYRSDDGGVSWTPLPTEGLPSDRVWALALDSSIPGRLVAAGPSGGLHLLSPAAKATGAGDGSR